MSDSICTADACFAWLSARTPNGTALIHGSDAFPDIEGQVLFYQRRDGVFVVAQITGLPIEQDSCDPAIFAMHIHDGDSCTGNETDPFADAGTHDNPKDCPHPSHAGDLPPLFGNDGYAWGAVFTNRFLWCHFKYTRLKTLSHIFFILPLYLVYSSVLRCGVTGT